MNLIKIFLIAFSSLVTATFAELPDQIAGDWVLDKEGTEKLMKSSPQLKAEGEQYLPIIINSMSQAKYTFAEDSITISMPDEVQVIKSKLIRSEGNTYIFETQVESNTSTLTITINGSGQLNMRSSVPAIADYSLWRRESTKPSREPTK